MISLRPAAIALTALGLLATAPAWTDTKAEAALCATGASGDLSLVIGATTYYTTSCANGVANGNPTQETAAIKSALSLSSAFSYIAKSDNANPGFGTLNGIRFDVDTSAGNAGSWTLQWTDTNGASPANLPLTMDLAVGIFGGSTGDAYLFRNVLLPVTPNTGTGTFKIVFTNNGGNNPAISHFDVLGGNMVSVNNPSGSPTDVPEPASMMLLGAGLAGLGVSMRRRSRNAG